MPDTGLPPRRAASIESRASWVAACATLATLSISYGAPLLVVVGLKPIQESLGTDRSVVALAGALVWVGTGLGGIMMGWLAERIGIRCTVMIGAIIGHLTVLGGNPTPAIILLVLAGTIAFLRRP